jgi:hypothetical protein
MHKAFFVVLIGALLIGCSTKHISTAPTTNLKLISNTVAVKLEGQNINASILDRLTREIKGQLIIAGFDIDKETDKNINLNVFVTDFTPGNAALRLTLGFGAGRGSLLYTAEYKDQGGKILAKMDGQERFTGGEVSFNQHYGGATTLGGEETATEVLVKEAAKHIVELALNQ